MHNKKGVSDVVTIVLTVMITIAAIGIIWAAVIPMIRTNLIDSSACNDVDISIDLDSGYTCNDEIKGYALVQVNKGPAQVNITELNFFVSSAGNSYSSTIGVNLAPGASEAILVPTSTLKNISKISVVPVVRSGNKLQQCKESYIEVVKSCSLSQEDFTKYREAFNKKNYWTSLAVSDLPDFKVGQKYDVYLKDTLCEPTEDTCEWSVHKVEEKFNDGNSLMWREREYQGAPMLPMGVSFDQEENLAHIYHKGNQPEYIPETKMDGNRPTEFKITLKIQRDGESDVLRTFDLELVA